MRREAKAAMDRWITGGRRVFDGRRVAAVVACGLGLFWGGTGAWETGASGGAEAAEAATEGQADGGKGLGSVGRRVEPFELKDQFEAKRGLEFPRGKVCVLVVADQKGAKGLEAWVRPLAERFGERVDFEGIADVSAAPPPLRGLVRNGFRKRYQRPVMLDWDGKVVRSFGYRKQVPNVYVIDREGRVHGQTVGPASAEAVAGVVRLVEGVLGMASTQAVGPGQAKAGR